MNDPRRPLLFGGLCLLGAGALAYLDARPSAVAPWLMLAGALALVVWFVLARVAKGTGKRDAESMLYEDGQSTMLGDPPKRDGD